MILNMIYTKQKSKERVAHTAILEVMQKDLNRSDSKVVWNLLRPRAHNSSPGVMPEGPSKDPLPKPQRMFRDLLLTQASDYNHQGRIQGGGAGSWGGGPPNFIKREKPSSVCG